jgi:two-component system, chemotaxis family, response regulator Rcp1
MDGEPSAASIFALLVKDEPADARLLIEVSKPYPTRIEFHHVSTGDEALSYLQRLEGDTTLRRPDVVFLDLNLPGRDGRFVLSAIRSDPELNRLPVIILTASPADADVIDAYDFKADACLRKPVELPELAAAFQRLDLGP